MEDVDVDDITAMMKGADVPSSQIPVDGGLGMQGPDQGEDGDGFGLGLDDDLDGLSLDNSAGPATSSPVEDAPAEAAVEGEKVGEELPTADEAPAAEVHVDTEEDPVDAMADVSVDVGESNGADKEPVVAEGKDDAPIQIFVSDPQSTSSWGKKVGGQQKMPRERCIHRYTGSGSYGSTYSCGCTACLPMPACSRSLGRSREAVTRGCLVSTMI